MKKIITNILMVSALLTAGILMDSCSKVDDLIDNITIPIPFAVPVNIDATVPVAIINTTDLVRTPEIPLNLDLDAIIKDKYPSYSINNLKSVKLNLFTIDYVSSENDFKLDVIKDANIIIKAPNMDEKIIATATGNTSETTISFTPVANLQLLDYLKSNQNSIILEVRGSTEAADIMTLKINSSFKLEVGL